MINDGYLSLASLSVNQPFHMNNGYQLVANNDK
jgi:hypothetical protein